MSALAIAIAGTSPLQVETFVRPDLPEGWAPPEGRVAIPADELPAGWVLVTTPPPPPPESVSPYQFRAWCVTHGITMGQIDTLIDAIPVEIERDRARVAWEYGLEVKRDHPLIEQFGQALGLDSDAIDQAFREASQIQ